MRVRSTSASESCASGQRAPASRARLVNERERVAARLVNERQRVMRVRSTSVSESRAVGWSLFCVTGNQPKKGGPHAEATRRTAPSELEAEVITRTRQRTEPPPRPDHQNEPRQAPRPAHGRNTNRGRKHTRKNEHDTDDRRQATRRPRTRGTSDNARTDDTTTNEPEAATDTTHLREKGNDRTDQTAAGRQSSPPRCQGVPQYESTLAPACPGSGSETRPTYRAGGPLQGSETRPTLNPNPAAVSTGAGGPGQAGAG